MSDRKHLEHVWRDDKDKPKPRAYKHNSLKQTVDYFQKVLFVVKSL